MFDTPTVTPRSSATSTPRPAQRSEVEQLRATIAQKDAQIARLTARLQFENAARRNSHLGAGTRHTLIALHRELDYHAGHIPIGQAVPVNLTAIAEATGQSAQTVSSHLKQLEQCGALERAYSRVRTADGLVREHLSITPTAAFQAPAQLQPPAPRNHGGKRVRCAECGSDHLFKRIYCADCGAVQSDDPIVPTGRQDDMLGDEGDESPGLQDDRRGTAPHLDMVEVNNQQAPPSAMVPTTGGQDDMLVAAWLAELAGDTGKVIEMMPRGDDKYLPARDPVTKARAPRLTVDMALDHLLGEHTYGTTLQHAGGMTRVLQWDADNADHAAILEDAAWRLQRVGACTVLEGSPSIEHPGGGYLALLFETLVPAADALATAYHHAPALATIPEVWPQSRNAVRLLFGRYVRPGVDRWCPVVIGDDEAVYYGMDAARRVKAGPLTPASWVTELAPPVPVVESAPPAGGSLVISDEVVVPDVLRTRPAAMDDPVWQARYPNAETMYFAFTEKQAAAYFNARYRVCDVLEVNRKGYAVATWRAERKGSVKVTDDAFFDYGGSAEVIAGDALEARRLVAAVERRFVFAETAADMVREAKQILEAAAYTGEGLPAWVHAITTPAGWAYYDAVRLAQRQSVVVVPLANGVQLRRSARTRGNDVTS